MESTYQLKWLNGLLAGRELALPDGELRLGGIDADVALHLEGDAEAVLLVDDAVVSLLSPTPTWVEGAPWNLQQPLPLGQVIDLAGQAFILGRSGDFLPSMEVPLRQDQHPASGAGQLGLAAALLLAGLVGVGWMFWQSAPEIEPVLAQDWLTAQLQQPDLAGLTLQSDTQGGYTLTGQCGSSSSVEALRLQMRERSLHLYDESVCADSLLDSVRAVLTFNGYKDVSVESDEDMDRVVISGNIVADTQWQRTSQQLKAIATLQGWRVVNDHEQLFNELRKRLVEKSALEGLSIRIVDGVLRVSGQLTNKQRDVVGKVLETFNDQAPRLSAVFQNLPAGALAATYMPSAIVGVGGNLKSQYLQLANGMRLQQDSVLPSGYKIHSLNRSNVMLLKGQELISLPLEL
ncbi:type III secretion system inner membrane ring subunit SctD [Pseudomonas zeae]|uniref:type III secretion system inner membrane ring subunit SctD n=1 Tax=Pseudomonas zeae TaxID=2745510 RepID=UPI0039E03309